MKNLDTLCCELEFLDWFGYTLKNGWFCPPIKYRQ